MTTINNITNYKELVAERTRLEMELQNQKLALKAEIDEAKTKLEPIAYAMSSLGFLKGKDGEQSSLLKKGMSMGIDFLVRDNMLSRAGWATKIVLPAVLKGVSKLFFNKLSSNKSKSKLSLGSTPANNQIELAD
jgi:hypothetical protein